MLFSGKQTSNIHDTWKIGIITIHRYDEGCSCDCCCCCTIHSRINVLLIFAFFKWSASPSRLASVEEITSMTKVLSSGSDFSRLQSSTIVTIVLCQPK